MSRVDNEQIMRTYLEEVVAKERLDLIPEIAAENMFDEATAQGGGPPGREGLAAHVMGFHAAFPDRAITIRKILANDDDVMAWWTVEGTQATEFVGVLPHRGKHLRSCLQLLQHHRWQDLPVSALRAHRLRCTGRPRQHPY